MIDQAVSGGAINPRGCGNLCAYRLGSKPKNFKEWLTMNGKEAGLTAWHAKRPAGAMQPPVPAVRDQPEPGRTSVALGALNT